jgi:hypothetical protein
MPAKKIVDTREEKVGQTLSADMPASGEVGRLDFDFETVDTPVCRTKLEELAFMDEKVKVLILSTGNENEEQFVDLGNDGIPQFIERNKPQVVKRKYVEVLARAKSDIIKTVPCKDPNGTDSTRIMKIPAPKYSFQMFDPNPNGQVWLQRILAEV